MRQSAQGWCTGMTQRDGMGREDGGGSGGGTHVHPLLIHGNVWEKPLQNNKKNNKVMGTENSLQYFKKLNINHVLLF